MFIKTFTVKKNNKEYKYYKIVKAIRKNGKIIHKVVLSLGSISKDKAEQIKEILSSDRPTFHNSEDIFPEKVYEFLSVAVLNHFFSYWALADVLSPLEEIKSNFSYTEIVKALVINRSLEPCSKLKLSNWYKNTYLSKVNNIFRLDENTIYRVMDALLPLEGDIQKHLYKKIKEKYPKSFRLIFYDLTSSYFEGSECKIGKAGYSRDHRSDKLQIVLGLVVSDDGFPFYWKVFPGNQVDITTLQETVNELKERFSISSCILVADRGLVSEKNISNIREKIPYIMLSDIPRKQSNPIFRSAVDILSSFKEESLFKGLENFSKYSDELYYKELAFFNGRRNILCFNPKKYMDTRRYREGAIKEAESYLDTFNNQLSNCRRDKDYREVDRRIDNYLRRKKVSHFLTYKLISKRRRISTKRGVKKIATFRIEYSRNQEAINNSAIFDGAYLIISNLKDEDNKGYIFSPEKLISSYKQRDIVDQAFKIIKSFIEIRPIYHRLEDRVKSHALICVLSYLLDNTIRYLLKDKINHQIDSIYDILNECKLVEFSIDKDENTISKITRPTDEQLKILKLLDCMYLTTLEYMKNLNKQKTPH